GACGLGSAGATGAAGAGAVGCCALAFTVNPAITSRVRHIPIVQLRIMGAPPWGPGGATPMPRSGPARTATCAGRPFRSGTIARVRTPRLPLLGRRRRGGPHPPHLDDGLLVLGPVVVHLPAVVDHVAARGRRHGRGRIELLAGADPPRAGDDDEEAIVRMEVRPAHVAGQPLQPDHVGTRLARIAEEHGLLVGAGGVAHPLALRGSREIDGGAVDLARSGPG